MQSNVVNKGRQMTHKGTMSYYRAAEWSPTSAPMQANDACKRGRGSQPMKDTITSYRYACCRSSPAFDKYELTSDGQLTTDRHHT